MEAVLAGRDVLAVMATGSGKSAIYRVPGVLLDGATLVISPLIALQRDQISGLAATAAPEAVAFNSQLDSADVARNWKAVRDTRVEMMRGYAETSDCRRQFLLSYFGEYLAEPCGNCDCCDAGVESAEPTAGTPWAVHTPVRHRQWGPGVVMAVEDDRITVVFDDYGYRTLLLESIRDSGVLERR